MITRTDRQFLDCPVRFTDEEGITGEGRLFNLSIGGCALANPTPMAEDTLLSLELQLMEDAAPVQIDVARVRWVGGRNSASNSSSYMIRSVKFFCGG
jgi:hypothetical protein